MATREIITWTCDLCGTDDMVETHVLTIDGQSAEAEACLTCWQKVVENIAVFSVAGRPLTPVKVTKRSEIVDFPGEAWKFASHALIRLGERNITPSQAALAAEDPEVTSGGQFEHTEVRTRGKIKVVVDKKKRAILTAAKRDEDIEHVK